MNKVILDASYLLALIDEKDKWHNPAKDIMEGLASQSIETIIFDCVANEVISVIGKRMAGKSLEDYHAIMQKALPYLKGERVTKLYSHVNTLYETIVSQVIQSHGTFSFHDALIIESAKALGISHIVSFDKDFDTVESLVRIKNKADLSKT